MHQLRSGEFLSAKSAERAWSDVRITETAYELGQKLPPHAHDGVYLVVMTRGVLRETASGRAHDLARGHVVFTSGGATHHDVACTQDTRCLNVELRCDVRAWLGDRPAASHEPVIYTQVGPAIGAVGRLQSALCDVGGRIAVEEALTELVGVVFPEKQRRDGCRWMPRTIDHLHDTFRAGLRLDDVAAVAGVHRTHLCRSFRAAVGCTIGEYVRRLRADLAYRRVTDEDAPLAGIAAECGYADQSHMTRDLRRTYGFSPSRLRHAAR